MKPDARKKAHDEESRSMREILRASGFMGNISIKAKAMEQEGADHRAAREQFAYWNKFWDRYDQRRHGEVKKKPARPSGFHRKNPLEAGKIREWRNNRMGRGADDE
jgi:pentatricopeptide repeat-containing protein PET309